MKTQFFIFCFILFTKILSIKILSKYGSTTIDCKITNHENTIAFDSSGFGSKEDMFFTFSLEGSKGLESVIKYKFEDTVDKEQSSNYYYPSYGKTKDTSSTSESKVLNKVTLKHYYTINKEEDKNYLIIGFDCTSGELTIENTKENDSGNKAVIIIIVVFSVFFVVIIIIVVVSVIRRRKARAVRMAARMQMASGAYYPPPGMGMSVGMGMGMAPAYGSNYMINNMPPQPNMMGSQPVAYSRMPNDVTQIEPNSQNPNEIPQPNSGMRIKKAKV